MNELVLISIVLLWIVVIALALAVFALSRQIGVLLERVAPAGALLTDKGLTPGETLEAGQLIKVRLQPTDLPCELRRRNRPIVGMVICDSMVKQYDGRCLSSPGGPGC